MAASFITATMDEDAPLIQAAFRAGRAYATEAARLRELHQKSPADNQLPETVMGPACVQIFLVVAQHLTDAKERVGAKNAREWVEQKDKLDAVTSISDMALLIRGFRVSSCHKEGMAKMVYSFNDVGLTRAFQSCTEQLGALTRPGLAPRSHNERVLQMAIDELEL
eukprot:3348187-Pyramimonas_sp.AAC.1